jgi:prephenate dehydrogenase
MVSFALVNIILNTKSIEKIGDFTGGGFRDFARLAHSDSTMWQDICLSNSKNIVKSINRLKKELDLIKSLINKKDKKLLKYFNNIKLKLEINDK